MLKGALPKCALRVRYILIMLPGFFYAGVDKAGLVTFLLPRRGNEKLLEDASTPDSGTQVVQPRDPHHFLLPGFIGQFRRAKPSRDMICSQALLTRIAFHSTRYTPTRPSVSVCWYGLGCSVDGMARKGKAQCNKSYYLLAR